MFHCRALRRFNGGMHHQYLAGPSSNGLSHGRQAGEAALNGIGRIAAIDREHQAQARRFCGPGLGIRFLVLLGLHHKAAHAALLASLQLAPIQRC